MMRCRGIATGLRRGKDCRKYMIAWQHALVVAFSVPHNALRPSLHPTLPAAGQYNGMRHQALWLQESESTPERPKTGYELWLR